MGGREIRGCSIANKASISPDVEFCGYSIPHPSEELMNIRIQTYGKYNDSWALGKSNTIAEGTALDALDRGLTNLMELCDEVSVAYVASRESFKAKQ